MDGFEKAVYLLPEGLKQKAAAFRGTGIEELRLRIDRRPTVLRDGQEHAFSNERITERDILRLLEKATGASLHSAAAALSEGYLSYKGLRIGVCGEAVNHKGELAGFRHFSSAAIRVPRECRGVCDGIIRELYEGGFESTLLISRPGGGKTTALREFIRKLSDRGTRISVMDERNELSASDDGQAQFDLGAHTDVLTGAPKADGAMMMLRAMNPQILAMDEITKKEDIEAISQASGCGADILASAHASGLEELIRRPLYKELLMLGIFKNAVMISGVGAARRYTAERLPT